MLRDKILFVITFQKLKKQVSLCHPYKEMNTSKCGKLIQTTTGYFLEDGDFLSLIPWSSTFQDGGWVKFPTLGMFRMSNSLPTCTESNSRGLPTPPPPPPPQCPIVGQTIDRYISMKHVCSRRKC